MERNFLLSYPRSGNTWTRYCVELLSLRPTTSWATFKEPEKNNDKSLDSESFSKIVKIPGVDNNSDPILIKKHVIHKDEKNSIPIIFILRNYKECLIRHLGNFDSALKHLKNEDNNVVSYIGNIKDFDDWDNRKILIYYEDLILKPEEEFIKICRFLECYNEDRFSDFLKNLEFHKKNSIDVYGKITGSGKSASRTGGNQKKLLYHSSNVSIENKRNMDRIIKKMYPDFFEKYLYRYREI